MFCEAKSALIPCAPSLEVRDLNIKMTGTKLFHTFSPHIQAMNATTCEGSANGARARFSANHRSRFYLNVPSACLALQLHPYFDVLYSCGECSAFYWVSVTTSPALASTPSPEPSLSHTETKPHPEDTRNQFSHLKLQP